MRNRTLRTALAATLLAAVASAAVPLRGDKWADVRKNGKGRVVVAVFDQPEFFKKDPDGKVHGFETEVVQAFADWLKTKKNIELKYEWVPFQKFDELYASVKGAQQGVFGVSTISILDSRRKEISFSPPFLPNIAVLCTNPATPRMTTKEEAPKVLGGMTALAVSGTTHESLLKKLKADLIPSLKIENRRSALECIEAVAANPGKYICYADLIQLQLLKKRGVRIDRQPAFDSGGDNLGIALPLGSDWTEPLGEFLDPQNGFTKTKEFQKLVSQHFDQEFAAAMFAMSSRR